MSAARAAGAVAGLTVDRMLAEPPDRWHPVAAFGRAMGRVEAGWWADDRRAGAAYTALGAGLGAGIGALLAAVGHRGRRVGTAVATGAAVAVAAAGRGLADAAGRVGAALDAGDLAAARAAVPALVGRDPAGLDEVELSRAVVESVAENTVDAMVGPLVWGALAGPAGAFGYRAVNTLDAMVGHRSPRYRHFGWASARLDDAVNLLPARLTALAVAVARPAAAVAVARAVARQAPAHPSPNAGVAEAAFAAALGLRLGGPSRYGATVEIRPTLGDGRPCQPSDIAAAVRLSGDASAVAAGLVLGAAVAARRRP